LPAEPDEEVEVVPEAPVPLPTFVTTGTVIDEFTAWPNEVEEIDEFPTEPTDPPTELTGEPAVLDDWYAEAAAELPLVAALVVATAPPLEVAPLAEPDATLEVLPVVVYEFELEATAAPEPEVLAVPVVEVEPVLTPPLIPCCARLCFINFPAASVYASL
jgi:hypothetical protein